MSGKRSDRHSGSRGSVPFRRHWLLDESAGAPVWSMVLFALILIGLGILVFAVARLG